jgi:hypothetical protein
VGNQNKHWEEILGIVKIILASLDGGTETEVCGFYFKTQNNYITGWNY